MCIRDRTLNGLTFTVWHFQRQIAVVACSKNVLTANMVVVSDLVIGCCKLVTALLTNCLSVIVCLLCMRQWRHVLIIGQYCSYYFTFIHYMFIKFIHYIGTTVHDGVALVLRILTDCDKQIHRLGARL